MRYELEVTGYMLGRLGVFTKTYPAEALGSPTPDVLTKLAWEKLIAELGIDRSLVLERYRIIRIEYIRVESVQTVEVK